YTADLPEVLTLFHETGKLYFRLFQSARERKVPILVDRFAPEQTRPTELQLLQTMWEETSSQKKAAVHKIGGQEHLHSWEAENPTEEGRQLAVEIRRPVIQQNYRYSNSQGRTHIEAF
ncbi:hypothetical protein BU183_20450, partial [Enterococcus faecium]